MWEPVTVVVKAIALAALCVYAVVGGISDLFAGGREVATGWALLYAVIATAGGAVVTLFMRRGGRSDLVRAEAAEWVGDTLLSVGVLVGFVIAAVLVGGGTARHRRLRRPGDGRPRLAAVPAGPAKLIGGGMREILAMSPPAETRAELEGAVEAVRERFGLAESFLRASKVGGRVDVEVDSVVGEESAVATVADCDEVREALHERLAALGHERSVVVAFTTDRRWAL